MDSNNQTKFYGIGKGSGLIIGMFVENSINPSARLIELAKLHRLKGISKLIQKVEKLSPDSEEFQRVSARLQKKISNNRLLDIKLVNRWGAKGAVEITKVIESRGSLRKSMGLGIGDPRQAHHILPIEALKESKTLQGLVIHGFDFNGALNGFPINPSIHSATHFAGHNEWVIKQLNDWEKLHPNFELNEAKQFVEKTLLPQAKIKVQQIVGIY